MCIQAGAGQLVAVHGGVSVLGKDTIVWWCGCMDIHHPYHTTVQAIAFTASLRFSHNSYIESTPKVINLNCTLIHQFSIQTLSFGTFPDL